MEYRLVRSRRRTIAVIIRPDGSIEVRAPMRASQKSIDRFLHEKEKWIQEKAALMRSRAQERAQFSLAPGESVSFLGKEYRIETGGSAAVSDGKIVLRPGGESDLRRQIETIFRREAAGYLPARVQIFADRMGGPPDKIKITGARTRWGSCSSRRVICFSWRLMMAPPEAVDYVVVHELAHLRHMDHSASFWQEVAQVLPDYEIRREMLRAVQKRLWKEGWQG